MLAHFAILSVFLLDSALSLNARTDWIPINPDELKMTSVAGAPDAAAVLLYRQVDRDDNGKLHIQRTLDVGVLLVDKQNYGVLRNFFQEVRTGDEAQIVLQPGASTAKR